MSDKDEKPVVAPAGTDPDVPPCPIHGGVQRRDRDHIGDGNWTYGAPVCPYCQELAAASAKAA